MKEIALKYHSIGLSVIPVSQNKVPTGRWKKSIETQVEPNGQFDEAFGIGIVCGPASQGLEVVDVDLKHDVTGTLWDRYKALVGDLLSRLTIEQTPSGGYHLIYRCEVIEGNKKLAMRYATDVEIKQNPNRKQETLIETRGNGGYIMCAPSEGYELVQGGFDTIPVLTVDERNVLLDSAKALNEVFITEPKPKMFYEDSSPFDEYQKRGDLVLLLQQHGWEYVQDCGENMMFKRPGSEHKWSAGLHKVTKLFYVFTSSTQFEPNKAYNSFQVLSKLNFNDDGGKCFQWLKDNGYGKGYKKITQDQPKGKFIAPVDKKIQYLNSVRNGSLAMGLPLGIKDLDEHWREKQNHLRCWLGIDNTGKSQIVWYIRTLLAKLHGQKTLIYAGENSVGNVYRKIIEFYNGLELKYISENNYKSSLQWVDTHFKVIEKVAIYTHKNVLEIANKAFEDCAYQSLVIDPYNSLYRNKKYNENDHSYDYDALGEMRQWIEDHNCCIDLICHAGTEASRRIHPKGHRYEGMVMPPGKADAEGGQKFANRTDDFMTIHRYAQSKTEWMWNEIHVRKIKETETGGKVTYLDNPVRLKMNFGQCGFEDEYGYDAMLKTTTAIPAALDYSEPLNVQQEQTDLPF